MKILIAAVILVVAPLAVAQQSTWSQTVHIAGVPAVQPVAIKTYDLSLPQPAAKPVAVSLAVKGARRKSTDSVPAKPAK
jgi:hypothetical protein